MAPVSAGRSRLAAKRCQDAPVAGSFAAPLGAAGRRIFADLWRRMLHTLRAAESELLAGDASLPAPFRGMFRTSLPTRVPGRTGKAPGPALRCHPAARRAGPRRHIGRSPPHGQADPVARRIMASSLSSSAGNSPAICPSCMTSTRSAIPRISSISLLANRIAMPCMARSSMSW